MPLYGRFRGFFVFCVCVRLAAPPTHPHLKIVDNSRLCPALEVAVSRVFQGFSRRLPPHPALSRISQISCLPTVTVSNCTGSGATTFFVYSGHGINYNSTNNALHVNYNSSKKSHSSLGERTSTAINKLTTSTRFNQKYVVLYTCNQLTNDGSTTKANNILKMMNGTRLMFGFASVMYLDSREATRFVQNMQSMNIVDAYLDAANRYQAQRDGGDSIARIVGYNAARYDWITATSSYAPSAASNLSSFSILKTVTIPHNGVKI